jgi:multidrug efflux pump subunit AcrA (membrane-fusion protein)
VRRLVLTLPTPPVQELKAIKVQQKAVPRQLAELQAEVAAAIAAASAASAAVLAASQRIGQLEAALNNASIGMPPAAGQIHHANDPLIAVLQQRLVNASTNT